MSDELFWLSLSVAMKRSKLSKERWKEALVQLAQNEALMEACLCQSTKEKADDPQK